jgi:hypothetical protein
MTMRPPRADDCRARALKCREQAPLILDGATRRQLLDVADHWDAMARDIEQIERMRKTLAEDRALWARLRQSGFPCPSHAPDEA